MKMNVQTVVTAVLAMGAYGMSPLFLGDSKTTIEVPEPLEQGVAEPVNAMPTAPEVQTHSVKATIEPESTGTSELEIASGLEFKDAENKEQVEEGLGHRPDLGPEEKQTNATTAADVKEALSSQPDSEAEEYKRLCQDDRSEDRYKRLFDRVSAEKEVKPDAPGRISLGRPGHTLTFQAYDNNFPSTVAKFQSDLGNFIGKVLHRKDEGNWWSLLKNWFGQGVGERLVVCKGQDDWFVKHVAGSREIITKKVEAVRNADFMCVFTGDPDVVLALEVPGRAYRLHPDGSGHGYVPRHWSVSAVVVVRGKKGHGYVLVQTGAGTSSEMDPDMDDVALFSELCG